jgi:hypothetical protein
MALWSYSWLLRRKAICEIQASAVVATAIPSGNFISAVYKHSQRAMKWHSKIVAERGSPDFPNVEMSACDFSFRLEIPNFREKHIDWLSAHRF